MDEVVLTIRGKKHYRWRAVDRDGNVLDILTLLSKIWLWFASILPQETFVPHSFSQNVQSRAKETGLSLSTFIRQMFKMDQHSYQPDQTVWIDEVQ